MDTELTIMNEGRSDEELGKEARFQSIFKRMKFGKGQISDIVELSNDEAGRVVREAVKRICERLGRLEDAAKDNQTEQRLENQKLNLKNKELEKTIENLEKKFMGYIKAVGTIAALIIAYLSYIK
jgi:hypothetical protein